MVNPGAVAQRFVPDGAGVLALRGFPRRRFDVWMWRIRTAVTGVLALLGAPVGIWGVLQAPRDVRAIVGAVWKRGGPGEAWRTLGLSVGAVCSGAYIAHAPHEGLSGYPPDLPHSPPPNRGRLLTAAQVAELFPQSSAWPLGGCATTSPARSSWAANGCGLRRTSGCSSAPGGTSHEPPPRLPGRFLPD